jgi:hypothetical protein
MIFVTVDSSLPINNKSRTNHTGTSVVTKVGQFCIWVSLWAVRYYVVLCPASHVRRTRQTNYASFGDGIGNGLSVGIGLSGAQENGQHVEGTIAIHFPRTPGETDNVHPWSSKDTCSTVQQSTANDVDDTT